jgi:hypothetical protein
MAHLGIVARSILTAGGLILAQSGAAAAHVLIGWSTVGMHEMDDDYSVSALAAPDNSVHAQLLDPTGHLIRALGGVAVTYEAAAAPDGLIDSTSAGKTNFWDHVEALFGVGLAVDTGLTGSRMPGPDNLPQPCTFDAVAAQFVADSIPITPYADTGAMDSFPLMRLVARDAPGSELAASAPVVLPVSEAMRCASCHASGSDAAAEPSAGWIDDSSGARDVRLNILRLHDDREAGTDAFQAALATAGYDAAGLFATAIGGTPVLCARCHSTAAVPGSGIAGVEPLTQAVHRRMAGVVDPTTGLVLGSTDDRTGCTRCHVGSTERGAMTSAISDDGTRAIDCQSCHGTMLDLASSARRGWIDEPVCQSCHTGTATHNNGAIRYLSALEAAGQPRVAVDSTFATNGAAAGNVLYAASAGHGGLGCPACHGAPHAEFPSSERNDNLQPVALQGHVGMLVECERCHGEAPATVDGGPHGLHPVGQVWVDRHPDIVGEDGGSGAAQCQVCHGSDYRGTVLSRAQGDRTIDAGELGTKRFWRGFQVGCYTCHLGPRNSDRNPNGAAVVKDGTATTSENVAVAIALDAADADGNVLTLRIVSQPAHGTAVVDGTNARYVPEVGFAGSDSFTFAAWDGSTDSNLGTVSVNVEGPPDTATPTATVAAPGTATPVPLATATATGFASPCPGDCDGNGAVTIDELIVGVGIALDELPLSRCTAMDLSGDGRVTIDELTVAVTASLDGCTTSAAPTAPASPTPSGAANSTPTPSNGGASFASIQPIFNASCTDLACHSAQVAQGGLVLESGQSYAALVNAPASNASARQAGLLRVAPHDPEHSFLLIKLTSPAPGEGQQMPFGRTPLPADQIQLIRDWIAAGAAD